MIDDEVRAGYNLYGQSLAGKFIMVRDENRSRWIRSIVLHDFDECERVLSRVSRDQIMLLYRVNHQL